jgi:hypothetical protein
VATPDSAGATATRARDAMRHHEVLSAGAFSGAAGAGVMLAVAAIGALAQDVDLALPLAAIGETLVGGDARAAKLALGAVLLLATCVGIGIVLAAIIPREFATSCAMGLGVGVAVLAAGVMMSTIVPWVNPGFRARIQVLGGTWTIAIAAFGATLGISPGLRRWIAGAARGAASGHAPLIPGVPARPTTSST